MVVRPEYLVAVDATRGSFERSLRGAIADRSGKTFEALVAWILRNAPEFRNEIDAVWLWNEWPGRDGPDNGIDIVARTVTGELWAVQAKGGARRVLSKSDRVDSFLAESSREAFSYRLLVTTASSLSANLERTLHHQEKPIGRLLLGGLADLQVVWPSSTPDSSANSPRVPSHVPLPHQEEALDAVVAGFAQLDRGQLILPCGTGKTLVGLWAAERLESDLTLVVVPSLALVAQTLAAWAAHTTLPWSYLLACSDETIGLADAPLRRTDELHVPATTDVSAIAKFVGLPRRRVIFATYNSLERVAHALDEAGAPLDLAIADEAHRVAGGGDRARLFLDDDRLPSRRRLFMTATPRYLRRSSEMNSMDDTAQFGPEFHRLDFEEAIEQGLLCDYRVVVVGVDDASVQRAVRAGDRVETLAGPVAARDVASAAGLLKAIKRFGIRKMVTFHSRVQNAKSFAVDIVEIAALVGLDQPLRADHINGTMSGYARDALLARLRDRASSGVTILTNAQCLTEGVDVPALDAVAFVDPKRSKVSALQAVGRVLRTSPGKQLGYIILPLAIDSDGSPREGQIDNLVAVLRALRAHDLQLGAAIDDYASLRGDAPPPERVIFDLPSTTAEEVVEAVKIRVFREAADSWEVAYSLLLVYAERSGSAAVPLKQVEAGFALGAWVSRQRHRHARGLLSADHVRRLESVPGWRWRGTESKWGELVSRLREYAAANGTTRTPGQYVTEDGYPLGVLATRARLHRRRNILDPQIEAELESLPGWKWDTRIIDRDARLAQLRKFVAANGHARLHQRDNEQWRGLRKWVEDQRAPVCQGDVRQLP